jgi:CO/xanthine dehydrogenase FAD-binding subunit
MLIGLGCGKLRIRTPRSGYAGHLLEDAALLALPETLDEALTAVSERPSARVMAGGTDLMQELSWRHYEPSGFVSLEHVSSLAGAEQDDGTLTIAAMTRIADLERGHVAEVAPGLARAASSLGTPQAPGSTSTRSISSTATSSTATAGR